jgi:uncharacterized protein YunC (DUF1805 family)
VISSPAKVVSVADSAEVVAVDSGDSEEEALVAVAPEEAGK